MFKLKKRKAWKKLIALGVIGAVVAGVVCVDKSMQVQAEQPQEFVYENDDVTEGADIESVRIRYESEESYKIEVINADGAKVETTYNGNEVTMIVYDEFGCIRDIESKDVLIDENDISDLRNGKRDELIKWKKKKVEEYKKQYWYRKGTDKKDKDKDYLRIGLNDNYKQFAGSEIGEHQLSYVEKLDAFREKYTLVSMSMIAVESGGVLAEMLVSSGLALGATITSIKNIFGKWVETKPDVPKTKEEIEKYIFDMMKVNQLYTEVEQAYSLAIQQEVQQ